MKIEEKKNGCELFARTIDDSFDFRKIEINDKKMRGHPKATRTPEKVQKDKLYETVSKIQNGECDIEA